MLQEFVITKTITKQHEEDDVESLLEQLASEIKEDDSDPSERILADLKGKLEEVLKSLQSK